MRNLKILLVGTSPLLLHRVARHEHREAIASDPKKGNPEEEALAVMSKDEHGRPAIPTTWLSDAIRRGCSQVKILGGQVSFARINSLVILPPGLIPIRNTDNFTPEWTVYSSIQHGKSGSKKLIAVIAPMFKDWMFVLDVKAAGDFPDDSLLIHILNEAGRSGIGLFHPPKKQFGQFHATILHSEEETCSVKIPL